MHHRRSIALLSLLIASCKDATVPGTGTLVVSIHPPPPGVQPAVSVSSDRGYTRVLNESSTLAALPTGTYAIVPSSVQSGGVRFDATPARQTLGVAADAEVASLEVTYAAATARLTVDVKGLPAGAHGDILVSGPLGFAQVVTDTRQFDFLEPGTYTMTTYEVHAGGTTYRATP